jgi:hypothetical protein
MIKKVILITVLLTALSCNFLVTAIMSTQELGLLLVKLGIISHPYQVRFLSVLTFLALCFAIDKAFAWEVKKKYKIKF